MGYFQFSFHEYFYFLKLLLHCTCLSSLMQDHFSKQKKMAMNLKYIGQLLKTLHGLSHHSLFRFSMVHIVQNHITKQIALLLFAGRSHLHDPCDTK